MIRAFIVVVTVTVALGCASPDDPDAPADALPRRFALEVSAVSRVSSLQLLADGLAVAGVPVPEAPSQTAFVFAREYATYAEGLAAAPITFSVRTGDAGATLSELAIEAGSCRDVGYPLEESQFLTLSDGGELGHGGWRCRGTDGSGGGSP